MHPALLSRIDRISPTDVGYLGTSGFCGDGNIQRELIVSLYFLSTSVSAGGIQLDTMFVDEGFGSLDENSLEMAMKALTSLAEGNRLVGIISHVAELKQRIEKQIVVTKDKTGGSKAKIVV